MKTGFNFIWTILLVALVTMGAKLTTDNTIILGDQNPANDKTIELSDGQIKWDSSSSTLKISNDDGSSFRDISTFTGIVGGGVNLFSVSDNADFEASTLSPWTASGGTFVIEAGSPAFDLQSGSWDASAAAENLDSALKSVPLGLETRVSCIATIQYKWVGGGAGDLKFQVINSAAGLIEEKDLTGSANWRSEFVEFTCPTSESVRIRITSTANAALILIDNATIGKINFTEFDNIVRAQVFGERGCHGRIVDSAGTPVLSTNAADCVTSITDNGVGNWTVNFITAFGGIPNCTVSTADFNIRWFCSAAK